MINVCYTQMLLKKNFYLDLYPTQMIRCPLTIDKT